MGWATIVYIVCVTPFASYQMLTDKSLLMGEMIGVPTMMAAMLLFCGTMIRTAMLLPRDFARLHSRARWLGILAGAFGFPILTYPAFIAVSRLSEYGKMRDGEDA